MAGQHVFGVKEVACQVCGEPLGTLKICSGMRGGNILYTNQNSFKDVVVKVKECTSTKCRAQCIGFALQKKV